MVEELQDSSAGGIHLGIALLDGLLQVRDLLFVPIRLLDPHLDAVKTFAIRNHGGHEGLIGRQTPLDVVPGLLHSPTLGAALMVGVRPIQAEPFPPAAPMLRGHYLAVEGQQRVGVPACLKDGFVHGSSARVPLPPPHPHHIDPFQRLIRTQNEPCHIPADVFKPLIPAKQRAIRGQTLADRLWHPDNWPHAWLPWSRFALLLLSSSISPYRAITFQVVSLKAIVSNAFPA